jgi:predicted RNase H-like nuclease
MLFTSRVDLLSIHIVSVMIIGNRRGVPNDPAIDGKGREIAVTKRHRN